MCWFSSRFLGFGGIEIVDDCTKTPSDITVKRNTADDIFKKQNKYEFTKEDDCLIDTDTYKRTC